MVPFGDFSHYANCYHNLKFNYNTHSYSWTKEKEKRILVDRECLILPMSVLSGWVLSVLLTYSVLLPVQKRIWCICSPVAITVVLCKKQPHKNLIIVVLKSRQLTVNNQSLWGTKKKIINCEKEYQYTIIQQCTYVNPFLYFRTPIHGAGWSILNKSTMNGSNTLTAASNREPLASGWCNKPIDQ